ncbi:MAG: DUF2892 domain-containing protein [Cyclobacteriaceae bacterium]
MKKNVGTTDKLIRMIVVLTIVVLYYTTALSGLVAIVSLALAGILTLTIYTNYCPLYAIFHLHTNEGNTTAT